MHLLIIQPLADPRARRSPYRQEVALLGARLREGGHSASLLLLDACDEQAIRDAVTEAPPNLTLMYVESLAADLAFRVADALRTIHPAPLILFGPFAALCPDEALSVSGAEAVSTGPADLALPAYLEARSQGPELLRVPGLWVTCETGVMRNPPAKPPDSLDDQPIPARDLYPFERVLDAAGLAEIGAARGGEAPQPPDEASGPDVTGSLLADGRWPVLFRPMDAVLKEIVQVANEHFDLSGFRIGNCRWTARPEWLAEFAPRYAEQIALPFRSTLHAPDVTDEVADRLAQAGCEEVRIVVGSGSTLIRNDVLGLGVSMEALEAAFASLRRAGVRTAAAVEVGAPYETTVSLDETVNVLKRLDPDRVESVLHYPAPGSRSHGIARENGLLAADPAGVYLAGRPAIALPAFSEDEIITACECLPYRVLRPGIVPLIRLARRVRIGRFGTLYERLVRPFLGPAVRRGLKT